MTDAAYRLGVALLWLSGAALVVAVVSLVVIAWLSRNSGGWWNGDE